METAFINTRKQNNVSQDDKGYVFWGCILFSLLIVARAFNDIFFYAFAGVSLIVFMISKPNRCVVFLFFLLPFATILKRSPSGMSFFTILFFLLVLKMMFFHQKIDFCLLIVLPIFLLYNIFFSGLSQISTIITMLVGILMIYYLRNDDINIDINSIVIAYSIAICLSVILALFKDVLPIINTFVTETTMRLDGTEYATRFSGLQGNPNYFTMDVTVALSAIIVLMYKNASSKIYTILLIALSIFGLMSVSKSFLFAWMLLMLCWFILSIKQGVGKFTKFMFVGIIGAALAYYFAYDYINTYLFRFTEDSDGTLDSITTGRWEIWSVYLKTIFNDTKILFLGNGLNTIIEKIELGAHNTYLEMLFALGIVGTIILMIALRISIGQAKFKGVVLIPVAILLVRMVAISILSYDNLWFYLAILEMLVCEHQKKDQINLYDRR